MRFSTFVDVTLNIVHAAGDSLLMINSIGQDHMAQLILLELDHYMITLLDQTLVSILILHSHFSFFLSIFHLFFIFLFLFNYPF